MQPRTLLITALLGVSLLFPAPTPAAKPRPTPALTPHQVCASFGVFAYTRALERDGGESYSVALERAMQWDIANNTARWIRHYHQDILAVIYRFPQDNPFQVQDFIEDHCHHRLTGN